jgi:MFS family permease
VPGPPHAHQHQHPHLRSHLRPRRLPGRVRLLIAARAVNQLGAFSLAFLTVLLHRDLGASLAAAGAISAAFGLATIPSRLLGGRLADRWGRRRTILAGLTGCAAAQLGLAASPGPAAAAVCAVLLGLVFELYEPPSQATIADAVGPAERAPAYALLTTALAVGNLGAGLIADVVGRSSLRWLFVVDAASCLACALVVRLALPDDQPADRPAAAEQSARADSNNANDADADGPSINPWRDRALLAMTAVGTVFALVYMLMLVSLPLSLTLDGLNPADAGLIMAVSTLTLVLARPALRTRPLAALSPGAAFGAGYALMAAGLAGYALAHTLPALLAPTALFSLGCLLQMGRAFAVVSALAPAGASARYLAVYGLSWGFATVLAPLPGTWLIGAFGPGPLWTAMAGLCLAMAISVLVAGPRLTPRPAVPEDEPDDATDEPTTCADASSSQLPRPARQY